MTVLTPNEKLTGTPQQKREISERLIRFRQHPDRTLKLSKTHPTLTFQTLDLALPRFGDREVFALGARLARERLAELLRHYSNRSDLLQQLQSASVILSDAGQDGGVDADGQASACGVIRSRRLRDRLSPGDVQALIDLYRSGTTAKQVAEKFGVSLRSVTRLLHQHGVGREGRRCH